ncbi:MAG: Coenzyme F420 hydrogenase/dehydrogenase, beta subunit C-terminal domain [Clostridia bacterium]|nr:Coenzyme F420 hydrogenase/dehydrogenase, beta subunit C-terminal domain [Clostridia bacterium]
MIKIVEKSKCSGCYACAMVCPKSCITMTTDEEGFWYPEVDIKSCINCGGCVRVCPIQRPNFSKRDKHLTAYAVKHKEDYIRLNSSSGGVFSALASYVLEKGGVVFGAGFDKNFNIIHKCVESVENLAILRGSKYVQSKIGEAYKEAENFLKYGRLVYFSGTPCQIEGLLAYLKRPYENLITQDLICHGVPSPQVWRDYIKYRSAVANGAKPRKIAFRAKNEGWKRYSVSFLFENDTEYRATLDKDPMMQVFLKNLCLRPSCYNCHFKTKYRRSDITLADFWGIKNILPEMDDDKGTSLVIIHSKKGEEVFKQIEQKVIAFEVDVDKAIFYNSAMIQSAKRDSKREKFLSEEKSSFSKVAEKYTKLNYCKRIKGKLKRLIKRILGRI